MRSIDECEILWRERLAWNSYVDHFQLELIWNLQLLILCNRIYSLPCQLITIANIPCTCWYCWLCWTSCSKLVQPAVPQTSSTSRLSLSVCQHRVNRDICVVISLAASIYSHSFSTSSSSSSNFNFNSICSFQLHLHLRLCLCRLFLCRCSADHQTAQEQLAALFPLSLYFFVTLPPSLSISLSAAASSTFFASNRNDFA